LDIAHLPDPASISQPDIRDAAVALTAAKVASNDARRTAIQLEQELPAAQDEDARADERLRAEGKPRLKGRPATQRHEKAIAEAQHEQRVTELAAERARTALLKALREHTDGWRQEVAKELEQLDKLWTAGVSTLLELAAKRSHAVSSARAIGLEHPGVSACAFDKPSINGLEFQAQQYGVKGWIDTGEILAALASLGQPELEPEPAEPRKPMRVPSSLEFEPGVIDEMAQRRAGPPVVIADPEDRADLQRKAEQAEVA
jgi:hypothetical protein